MLRLMMDNLQIGHQEGVEGDYTIALEEWVPAVYAPMELFTGKRIVSMLDFVEWINGRVFPPERIGAEQLLKELGLDEYRPFAIAKETKACLMEDPYWVAFEEGDSFKKDTVRGSAGFPEMTNEMGKVDHLE
ncbi:MAG TPA: hypothetical protein VFC58_11585 [Desulfosporosinus sp.]|nr:hypothetical protein [Desulfosporosinus sp.]